MENKSNKSNPMKIEIYQGKNGEWGYRFLRSGRILVHAYQYDSLENVRRALESFIDGMFSIVTDTYFMDKVELLKDNQH